MSYPCRCTHRGLGPAAQSGYLAACHGAMSTAGSLLTSLTNGLSFLERGRQLFFRGDDLCCASVLNDCGDLNHSESTWFWIQPIVRIARRWHAFVLEKTMKMDQLKIQFLLWTNFFCCRESSLKSSPGPTGGRVLERKRHTGPKTRGSFLVGMPPTPHCPMTCFMQVLLQFEETNCASSVSIKTSVPWSSARAAQEVNWPQAVFLPSPQ